MRRSKLVLVDADTVGRARTGDEAYTVNLLRELPFSAPDLTFAASLRDPAAMPDDVPQSVRRLALPVASPYRRIPFALPRLARSERAALLHVQYFVAPRLSLPSVVTVHDLSFARRPELFGCAGPHAARAARARIGAPRSACDRRLGVHPRWI